MGVQAVVEEMVSQVRSNVEDPNYARKEAGKGWVFDDIPRPDVTGYPRIGIVSVTAQSEPLSLGYEQEHLQASIRVLVFARHGSNVTYEDTEYRAEQLADRLADLVVAQFKSSSSRASLELVGCILLRLDNQNSGVVDDRVYRELVYRAHIIR